MRKLLYITDQDEYTDHSFIGPLFEKYLKKFYDVDIIYFSEFKAEFEKRDRNRFIFPLNSKKNLIKELKNSKIDISSYYYIVVRNDAKILKNILNSSKEYNYKVGYRLSFPKRRAKLEVDKANRKSNIFKDLNTIIATSLEKNLINQCDIFLPASRQLKEQYFKDVTAKTFICPPAIDPEILHENVQHKESEKRFFYAGTLDKLREFETVLEAFSSLNSTNWKLIISTKDPQYAKEVINSFDNLKQNIEIHNAKTKKELLDLISEADIGVSILPSIPLFDTSTPVKIIDYYSSAIPCIMTDNANSSEIFINDKEAWFCEFSKDTIKKKLEYILDLPKEEVAQVGMAGQKKLLATRNYERIAADLAHQLDIL
jgi:glycosyltransferase involved in cell wall biosynthesis